MKNARRRMKGQFFLLTAFFLILIFYIGISMYFSPSHANAIVKEDLANLFENIENEYPRAFNFGMNASSASATLANFTNLVMNATDSRGADLAAVWIITQNVSDDVNVTVGNFLGYAADFTIEVSGDSKTIHAENAATGSMLFSSPPSEFELRASFNTTEKNLLLEKYKVNLYLILDMRKGDDKITGEIKA